MERHKEGMGTKKWREGLTAVEMFHIDFQSPQRKQGGAGVRRRRPIERESKTETWKILFPGLGPRREIRENDMGSSKTEA